MEAAASQNGDWTIGKLLAWTTEHLNRSGIEDARLSAEVLLAHAANCRRIQLYTRFDEVLPAEPITRFRESVRRAARHEPIAYVVGEKEFFSLAFHVTRDVLIPRPETETLVEVIVDHCRRAKIDRPRIWDIGAGSGCIGIAILAQLPQAQALFTDISAAALAVARQNAERHRMLDRIQIAEAAGLALPDRAIAGEGFDVLVSNPPYIPCAEVPGLRPEVKDFEPRCALTDEADGLTFYRGLAAECAASLRPDGRVFVEIADGRAPAVMQTMLSTGSLVHVSTTKDRVTGLDRVMQFKSK